MSQNLDLGGIELLNMCWLAGMTPAETLPIIQFAGFLEANEHGIQIHFSAMDDAIASKEH